MSAPSPVAIPVGLLSGEQLEVRLRPTDTAAELLAKVERRLGGSPLHDVHLCVGPQRLGAAVPAAELAALLAGGGFVQALRSPSVPKALRYLVSECVLLLKAYVVGVRVGMSSPRGVREFVDAAERCSRALETLLELSVDVNDRSHSLLDDGDKSCIGSAKSRASQFACRSSADAADAVSCRRFAGLAVLLINTRVREGRRQLDRDATDFWYGLFAPFSVEGDNLEGDNLPVSITLGGYRYEQLNEVVIGAIQDTEWHRGIEGGWQQRLRRGGLREAMHWLATEHPQEAVRAAAAEASAAHAGPRAPEAPPRGPAEAAAGAAAGAPAASDGQEEEDVQVAEAIEESRAGAVHEEQRLLQEALLRSKECSAAVAVDVVRLRYNHDQKWLVDALFAAGCKSHRSGAKMFLPLGAQAAVEDYEGWDPELKTSDVIVAPEWESTIHSAVDAAKEALVRSKRRSTKVTDRETITIPEVASDLCVEPSEDTVGYLSVEPPEDTVGYQVIRTFVHVSVPKSTRSASSGPATW